MSEDIKSLNKRLKNTYGVSMDGRPFFRLVFSDTQTEKRIGTFREFYGPIFVREETKLAERPKYAYIKGRFILERLVMPPDKYRFEIDLCNGTYEPVWTFERDNQYQHPEWHPITYIVRRVLLAITGGIRKLSDKDIWELDKQQFEKEVDIGEDMLANESPMIAGQLANGEGIVVPSNYIGVK